MAELLPLRPPSPAPDPLWRHLLGERLRRMRHERGETLATVARRAGVSVQYLSEIERGRKEPSSEIVAAILSALDRTLLDLTAGVADELRSIDQRAPQPYSAEPVPALTASAGIPAGPVALVLAA